MKVFCVESVNINTIDCYREYELLRIFDSREKAVKFIENKFGDRVSYDEDERYWIRTNIISEDHILITEREVE